MKIVVLGASGCLPSAFLGLLDVLSLAAWAIGDRHGGQSPFQVFSASLDGGSVRDGYGRQLPVDRSLSEFGTCDAVVVPGFVPDKEKRPPSMKEFAPAAAWLRSAHAKGALVCGSCSGVFLLAEAGLLDRRRCTTTWWLHDELRHRYPRIRAIWASPLIEQERVTSAGGPLSWIDIAMHIVKRLCGAEAARLAANFAVVDTTPSAGAVYNPLGYLNPSSAFLAEAERLVRHAGAKNIGIRELASAMAVSERTLHRRIMAISGESPKRLIDRVRLETARTLLESSSQPIKHIAASVGYADEGSFRRRFKRLLGSTPAAYRETARRREDG